MATALLEHRDDRFHRVPLVRGAPPRVRVLRGVAVALALAAAACASNGNGGNGDRGGTTPVRLAPFETYVLAPTEIRADDVTVNLPAIWAADVAVSGLSPGWVENEGKRRWTGAGDCRLVLHELEIRSDRLTVWIVPEPAEPEFLLHAEGDVVLAHVSRGIGNISVHLDHLFIRNDERIER